jgi:hypothetical protein
MWVTARKFLSTVSSFGVHHHRSRSAGERAGTDEVDLPPVHLLCGCPEHRHGDPELVDERGQGDARPDRRRGDDVVSAGVADLGEGIELAADHHLGAGVPDPRREGGIETVRRVLDSEPAVREVLNQMGRGLLLLERDLRMLVHPPGEISQFRFDLREPIRSPLLGVHVVSFRCPPGW